MAKYEIERSCGCVETVDVYGTNVHGERDRKIAWLGSLPCRECEARASAEKAEEDELRELSGSPKQVAWALDIRNEMIAALETGSERAIARRAGSITEEQAAEARAKAAKALGSIEAVDKAEWFIDNRFSTSFASVFKLALSLGENAR